jgi:hypothetical protein
MEHATIERYKLHGSGKYIRKGSPAGRFLTIFHALGEIIPRAFFILLILHLIWIATTKTYVPGSGYVSDEKAIELYEAGLR